MEQLNIFQKEAVKVIFDFFFSDRKNAKMYISTGVGKTNIILNAIYEIKKICPTPILVLVSSKIIAKDMISKLRKLDEFIGVSDDIKCYLSHEVIITIYNEIGNNELVNYFEHFGMIICDTAERLNSEDKIIIAREPGIKCLAIISDMSEDEYFMDDFPTLYDYTLKDMIYSTSLKEQEMLEHFLRVFLKELDFKNLTVPKHEEVFREELIAEKNYEKYIIGLKLYRSLNINIVRINELIKKTLILKSNESNNYKNILIVLANVDDKIKMEILERFNIEILDISNVLYLCSENEELIELLTSILPYSISEINPKRPLRTMMVCNKNYNYKNPFEENKISIVDFYSERLKECKFGKINNSDKKYEEICNEIITYLFRSEFYKISSQHQTEDKMFRMDLLCSLKGIAEFWKFLIDFYKTKFVVFEYKNYSGNVCQNDIYVTEKYLFSVALRNVAFIISRKGFDGNAKNAALGSLREHGYLIIDLTDNDLIKMLEMAENGEEPSDYLLDKVENLLMSVSK